MNIYQILLSFLAAINAFIFIYYFTRVIKIYRKFDEHFFFCIATLGWFMYIFFQLLLSNNYDPSTLLWLHRIKILGLIICAPCWIFTIYSIYIGKSIIPKIFFIFSLPFYFLFPFNIFISLPVKILSIDFSWINFKYSIGKTHIAYSLFSSGMVLTFIISIAKSLLSDIENKNKIFASTLFLFGVIGGFNDFSVSHGFIKNPMITEYVFFIFIFLIFLYFLNEDNDNYRKLQRLTEDLKKERDEAYRRLKITEVYTKKSLVNIIENGENPIDYKPRDMNNAVMFNDIRDFTSFSEKMTPIDVVGFLNAYFNRVNEIIIENNGEIDKLIGDCIMAGFSNPDDAIKTAISLRSRLYEYNRERINNNLIKINTGIGITYGPLIVGNIGSQSKMDYTLIGDTVNTASRLESLTKLYKVGIIISEDAKGFLKSNYEMRFLDLVQVKGKKEPIKIYDIYEHNPENIKDILLKIQSKLDEAFYLYSKGNLRDAHSIYSELIKQVGKHTYDDSLCADPVLHFYKKRCVNISNQIKSGLISRSEWSGVYEFIDK